MRDPISMGDLDDHDRAAVMLKRTGRPLGPCRMAYGPVPPMPPYDPATDTRPATPARHVRDEPGLGERMYEAWAGSL